MKSSTNRALVAKKQSTSFAQVANNLLNLLQGYTKGIRFLAVLTMLLTIGIGQAWGATTWTWTADNGNFGSTSPGTKTGTVTLNGKSWNYSRDEAGYLGWGNSSIQFGSKNNPENVTLSTSAFSSYTITSISVKASSYNGAHKLTIKVGDATVKSATTLPKPTSSPNAISTGTISKKGDIRLEFSNKSRALYIQSISVTYEEAAATVPVTGVSLNTSTLMLTEGDSETLRATIAPANATDKTVTWSTSDANFATVSNGKVTAVAEGSATITVKTKDGNKTAICSVIVNPKPKYTVTLKDDNSTLTQSTAGATITLPSRDGCAGYTFVGWTNTWKETQTTWTTTAPTIIPTGSYTPTANENLYPVYTKTEGGGTAYEKATTLTEGVYVMVSEKTTGTYKYMPNTTSFNSNPTLGSGITMNSGKTSLTNNITEAMLWDLTATGTANQYYLRPHGSTTIGLGCTNSTGANIRISTSYKDVKWTITTSSSYGWQFKSNASTAMYLAVYTDDNWRNYTSSTTNQNGKFYLFKQTSSSTTYYISVPDCGPTCTDPALAYATATITKTVGDAAFTNPLTNGKNVSVTYTSTNTNVATVDNVGQVTIKAVGETTIKATWDGSTNYCADEASYTLTVNPKTYTITVAKNISNGYISADKSSAVEGATIKLTATPNTGYKLDTWNVKDASNNSVSVNANGEFTMPASNVTVSATFVSLPKLATPTNLGADNITTTSATLTWEWSDNENSQYLNGYNLYYKKVGDANFTGPITCNSKSSTRNGLTPNTEYVFKVAATSNNINECKSSEQSAEFTFKTKDLTQLAKPTNLPVTNITCTEATLSWDAVTNKKNYKLTYTDGVSTKEVTTGSESVTLNNLLSGTTYTWEIQAIGDGTNYANSEVADGGSFTTNYKITYNVKGGTWTACADGCVAGGEDFTICSTEPSKDGCNFVGWSTADDTEVEYQAGGTINNVSANTTLYAVWEQKKYTVNWYVNSTSKREQTGVVGAALTDIPEPTTVDCDNSKVFVGWTTIADYSDATDAPDGMITNTTGMKMPEGGATYYAVFATAEGGGGSVDYSSTHTSNVPINAGTAITNTNVIIESKEYAATKAGTGSASGSVDVTIPAGTTQLSFHMAGWNGEGGKTITLTGATADPSSFKTIADAGVSGNGKYTLSGDVAQYAYSTTLTNITQETKITFANNGADQRFVIWGVNASTGVSYSDYTTTCDNTKATITYNLNGGTGATCGKTIVTKDVEFSLCNQTPTKTGYNFAGWTDGVNTYNAGASTSVTDNTKFYAAWTAKTIKITWDQNYTDCPESETSTYIYDGEDIEMPEDPIRTGYKFTGWYTASTDGTKITEVGTTNKPTDDVTYYAHWNELYSVTFMVSGQVYVVQEDKYLSGANLELPADPSPANYACDGYIFDGWSVAEKTIEEATKPELITNPTITKDEIYYAVWKKATTEGAGETIFYESFNDNDADGGNDGKFNTASNTEECYVDNEGWEGNKFYEADQCIKLGGSSAKGYITTPKLSQLSGNATLSFKAAAWNGNSESTTLKLTISGGGTLTPTSETMVKGAWNTYEVQIKDGTPSSTITFAAANAANNRFFLDEVMITTSGSYNYTTSPSCGPTMVARENVWVTSANGQSVKVNVPLGIKLFEGNATITGTSTNENFVVNTLENAGNGEHQVVVVYTPTADDTKENTTITLTAKNGEDTWATTTFVLNGRSLPNEFVVVANRGDKNYALPANMAQANVYAGLVVEVNGEEVIAAPKSYLYNVRAVHSTRFDENGTAIRLVGNNDACLWASNAVSGTSIRNWAKLENANTANYEWYLYTEDGDTYYISSTAVTEEGRVLRLYGNNFGMYKEGVNTFRFFPVGCTSTPMNVQTSTTRTSATISWTNASECNVVVKQGSTTVQSISAAASPVVVSNLAESTAYTFTLTPADNESCVASGAFTTTGPTIDIVEWETNGILIQVDKDNELNPKVVIKGEEEHGNVGGNVADELFFSKYFEAHAENKLLAIFNGTTATIDLTGYTIKSENGTLDLSQFGQTKGKVASNEEIILVYYDANYSAEKCAEEQQGYENWNILTEKSVLAFSGRGSIGLYKNDVLIDVIGSTFPSGELTKIGKSDQGCGTEDDVRLHIDGNSVNDESSFFCFNGDNIKTDNVETDYALSTNRCLLIRKNTVTSGANAVATNKAAVDATCGELSSTFATLCSEWSGFRIGSGKSSTDEIKNATCDGLGYVGGFDYNNYYRTLETLDDRKTLEDYTRNPDENTYFIEIEDLAQYSCLNIQLQLTDNVGNVLTEQTSQVPILVAGEKSTTDEIFSAIVKDSETSEPDYETSKIRCSTCDVVILKNATLTKAALDTDNDVNQVRDIYIYPGGKLVVPANATDYSVNNISLRRVQDEVAAADIQAPLNITSSSKAPIFVDVRIDANNWHWFALPYDCNIADVTWADGSKAAYNTDWFLMYYDGESRAASTNPYDNHWKVYNGTTIEAGKGYIVGITGDVSKPAVKFELRFPMAQDVLTAEKDDKKVAVNAWGVKSGNKPNNLGWNLVGNPYLNYYKKADGYSLAGLPLIKYTSSDLVVGEFYEEENGNIPFLVTPIDGGWYEYRQELASEVNMMPFTAYFVQVGDPNTHENGQELKASFEASNRGKKSIVRRAPREVEEIEEPIIVRVELTNSKGESDKTSLVIDDRFTNEYEMNGDFFKWFGDYYNYYTKPVLYTIGADQGKRAFNALNEELAKQPIPMGMYAAQAGNYTFSLNQQFDLSRVEEIWLYDATQSSYTNLMQSDYTFSTSKVNGAGRFSLSVKLAPKVATSIDNVTADKVWATTHTKQVIVNGLENGMHLWLYDATGKLLYNEPTSNYQHTYSVPQTGTYFVSVMNGNQKQTIKVVVK